jgi:hypothetical protein
LKRVTLDVEKATFVRLHNFTLSNLNKMKSTQIESTPKRSALLSPDELTLHLIATGLVEFMTQYIEKAKPLKLPYPKSLQHGLDKLVVACLRSGMTPPQGVPDLLIWCRDKPIAQWPIKPSVDEAFYAEDKLLDDYTPTVTRICEDWACANPEVEDELTERKFFLEVLTTCQNANAPETYVAFRRLLINDPVLTELELQQHRIEPDLVLLAEAMQLAYEPAPIAYCVERHFHCCSNCGNLLRQEKSGQFLCETDHCRMMGKYRSQRQIKEELGVMRLKRGLRRFIALPGLAELRLEKKLTKLGLQVELWPNFDKYDLRIVFPNDEVWAVDVKDWANPFLLARKVNENPIPNAPSWEQAYFIFPNERKKQRSDYLRAFRNHCEILNDKTKAMFEQNFITQVKNKLKQVNNA